MFAHLCKRLFGKSPAQVPDRKPARKLSFESLEDRITPSVSIQFDYSYDTSGFFSGANASRRAVLQSAADSLTAQLGDNLAAITPGGGNTWSATTFNPSNHAQYISIPNLSIAANTLVVFVGAEGLGSYGDIGLGAPGGVTLGGIDPNWYNLVQARGQVGGLGAPGTQTDFGPWGGSLTFDSSYGHWYFGIDAGGIQPSQVDFWSSAQHELGHLLGYGTANSWHNLVSGTSFLGSKSRAEYGSNVPVDAAGANAAHWAFNTLDHGQHADMGPQAVAGARTAFTALDYAGLYDMGWTPPGAASASSGAAVDIVAANAAARANNPTAAAAAANIIVVGADAGAGSAVNVYDARTLALKTTLSPFGGFGGGVRVAVGDVNGDGTPDIICAAGPGGGPSVRVYDGKTFAVIRDFTALPAGFAGGVFVAAGDVNGDGFADIVTSADAGGGPQVTIWSGRDGSQLASFYATTATFTGGIRVSVADVNGDGFADVIAAAGAGGGPQVTVFDGRTLKIATAFYALMPTFTGGLYIAAGDLNGDGKAEIISGAEKGGGPQVTVFDGQSQRQLASFYALPSSFSGGVRVGYSHVGGKASILGTAGPGAGPQATAFDGQSQSVLGSFFAFDPSFRGGLYVAGS